MCKFNLEFMYQFWKGGAMWGRAESCFLDDVGDGDSDGFSCSFTLGSVTTLGTGAGTFGFCQQTQQYTRPAKVFQ